MAVGGADNRPSEGGLPSDIEAISERWDGMTWTGTAGSSSAGSSPALYAVSCTSPSFCVAVGSTVAEAAGGFWGGGWSDSNPGKALVEQWNGVTWTVQPTPAGTEAHTELSGVSCSSDTSCVAVGARGVGRSRQYGLAETWNGTSWNETRASSPGKYATWLTAISCVTASWCTAVGGVANHYIDGPPSSGIPFAQPIAERWNGSRWVASGLLGSTVKIGLANDVIRSAGAATGVSCTSSSSCIATGYFQESQSDASPLAYALRWNGRSWTKAGAGLSRFARLTGVSCSSSFECDAVGTSYRGPEATTPSSPLVAVWDGSRWSSAPLPSTQALDGGSQSGFAGVSCVPLGGCAAVGAQLRGDYEASLVEGNL